MSATCIHDLIFLLLKELSIIVLRKRAGRDYRIYGVSPQQRAICWQMAP